MVRGLSICLGTVSSCSPYADCIPGARDEGVWGHGKVSGMWLSLCRVRSAKGWLAQVRGPSYDVGQSHFFSLPWTGSGFGILPHVLDAQSIYHQPHHLCIRPWLPTGFWLRLTPEPQHSCQLAQPQRLSHGAPTDFAWARLLT